MLLVNNLYGFGARLGETIPTLIVDSADFDSTDVMNRGANLTGIANTNKGILSAWVRFDSGSASQVILFGLQSPSTTQLYLQRQGDNTAYMVDSAGHNITGSTAMTNGSTWWHILISWDGDTSATHLYLNDVEDKNVGTINSTNATFTSATNWKIGDDGLGQQLSGCLAELYFAPGQYLDFSTTSNRRKFINSSKKPVDLGSTGSLPTGTAPRIYQHLADAEAVANFATNRGTGGNFTISGTLTTGSTSPSD